jgi:hypothetical protein
VTLHDEGGVVILPGLTLTVHDEGGVVLLPGLTLHDEGGVVILPGVTLTLHDEGGVVILPVLTLTLHDEGGVVLLQDGHHRPPLKVTPGPGVTVQAVVRGGVGRGARQGGRVAQVQVGGAGGVSPGHGTARCGCCVCVHILYMFFT